MRKLKFYICKVLIFLLSKFQTMSIPVNSTNPILKILYNHVFHRHRMINGIYTKTINETEFKLNSIDIEVIFNGDLHLSLCLELNNGELRVIDKGTNIIDFHLKSDLFYFISNRLRDPNTENLIIIEFLKINTKINLQQP